MPHQLTRLAGIALLASAVTTVVRIARTVPEGYELGYGEGLVLWMAQHATEPSRLYHTIDQYPYVVGVYPPGFPLIVSSFQWLVGDLRLAGRMVSMLAFLGTLAAIAALARQAIPRRFGPRAGWTAAATGAGLAASVPTLQMFPPAVRVDGLGLCLAVAGLWLFLSRPRHGPRQYLALAILAAAVLTKQSYVSALLACLAITAVVSVSRAWRFAVFAIGVLFIPIAWLQYSTGGQFLLHVGLYPQNEFSAARLQKLLIPNVRDMLPLMVLAAASPVSNGLLRDGRLSDKLRRLAAGRTRRQVACLMLYVGLAFMVSLTAGKVGSGEYYFMEWNAGVCVLAGVAAGFVVARGTRANRHADPILAVSCVAVLLVAGLNLANGANGALRLTAGSRELAAARREETDRAVQFVRSSVAPVIAEDLSLLVTAGRDVPFEAFIMSELSRQGRWNPAPFLEQLNQRFYAALIFDSDIAVAERVPPGIRTAMLSNYHHVRTIGRYLVYEPR